MDKLLMQKPRQLDDERKEVFALIDRFAKSIKTYQDGYAELMQKCNGDIEMREQQKSQVLKVLAEQQKKEKDILETDHSAKLHSLNESVEDTKKQASRKLDELENRCRERINSEQAILNGQKNSDDSKRKLYKEILSEISMLITRVDTIMGTTFTGESKFEKVCKNLKLEIAVISDSNIASSYISKNVVSDVQLVVTEIQNITESLPKKIIFNNKRTACIKKILEIRKNAENAFKFLEKKICNEQISRNRIFEQKSKNLREECNKGKQSVIEIRDTNLKRLRTDIEKENNKYTNRLQDRIVCHNQVYDE